MLVRKNVLMTASSSGHAAMACEHAARGSSNLALCARRAERLEARKRELFAAHPGIAVEARALDVNDHDRVFQFRRSCRAALGSLDRVIVNAGISRGVQVGTTGFEVNKSILRANLVAALAQCEAAVEILRHQNRGHLVAISSVSPMRGLSRRTACAASKSGLATTSRGNPGQPAAHPITVTTIFPGYIESEMTAEDAPPRLIVSNEQGVVALMKAIDAERAQAQVPPWPWVPLGFIMRHAPLQTVSKA